MTSTFNYIINWKTSSWWHWLFNWFMCKEIVAKWASNVESDIFNIDGRSSRVFTSQCDAVFNSAATNYYIITWVRVYSLVSSCLLINTVQIFYCCVREFYYMLINSGTQMKVKWWRNCSLLKYVYANNWKNKATQASKNSSESFIFNLDKRVIA